jgi:drug/metabolite transporter (DMT)-like permease
MNQRWIPFGKVIFAVIAWGISFGATKTALQEVTPVTVVWLRFAIGLVVLGMAVAVRRQFVLPGRKDLGYFAVLGFIGITFHQWLQSNGLMTSQASTSAWIVVTTPIFIAFMGWAILREKMGWMNWAGIGLASLGVLLVVSKGDWRAIPVGKFGVPGDYLILISAPNWALFSVLSRRGLREHPAARMMLLVMGMGWLFTTLLLFAGPGINDLRHLTIRGWLGIGFLGVFCSGWAYIFWYDALQALPANQVGVFLYLEPFVTMVLAAMILGEPILWASLAGGGIILAGVWLVQRI